MSIVVIDGDMQLRTIATIDDLLAVVATAARQDTANTALAQIVALLGQQDSVATEYVDYQQITDLTAAVSLTVPDGARWAIIQPETESVRLDLGGGTPTATVGMPLQFGGSLEITTPLTDVRVIEAASGAILNVWYFA